MVWIICIDLPTRPFPGLVGKVDYPSMAPTVSITVGIFPVVGFFIFTRRTSNTLTFRKIIEESSSLLRVPLLIFLVQHFYGGGSEVVGKFHLTVNFCASCWGFSSAWSSRRSPLLSPGCWYLTANLAALWRYLSRPLVPCDDRVSKVLG